MLNGRITSLCAFEENRSLARIAMLEVEQLSIRYPNGVQAIRDVSLSLKSGRLYGVLGPSGAGKSSLLKGMLGLVSCQGRVRFQGKPLREFSKEIAYVEQKENIDRDFPITALECVLLGTYPRLGVFSRPGKAERARAREALRSVGLAHVFSRQIGELSGGQFQRVLIARALVQEPTLLFLDEPFVGLDVDNEANVVQILKSLRDRGVTIFIVHHDLSKVVDYFDEVLFINEGLIAYGSVDSTFTEENIARTFRIPRVEAPQANSPSDGPWITDYGHHAVHS